MLLTEAVDAGRLRLLEARSGKWLVVIVLAVALAHRAYLYFATDFPINDGGLFFAFVQQIAQTFPQLPAHVSYNGLDLPFAYPPLSFWVGALLTRLGVDTLAIFHAAPLLLNALYIALFALILRRSGQSTIFVAVALLFFCTTLRTFEWLVMGGGLSRGMGSIFLMLTLVAVGLPDGTRKRLPVWRLIAAGVAVGGAILSHLEWGLDSAASVVLISAFACLDLKDFVRRNLIVGVTSALAILPWIAFVVDAHGLAPFLSAGGSGGWDVWEMLSHLAMLSVYALVNPLIGAGLVLLLLRRSYFWPCFYLMLIVVTPRHAATPTTIPLAIFAATGAFWVYQTLSKPGRSRRAALVVTSLFAAFVIGARFNGDYVARGEEVRMLGHPQRDAMNWVAREHPGASFIVLTKYGWWYDASAEWFPVLARARSTNTVQGREWIPGGYVTFDADDILLKRAKGCAQTFKRLEVFERPEFLWAETRRPCFRPNHFRPVYRNREVTIYKLLPGALANAPHAR